MASILDVTLLSAFSQIFVFLLVFVIIFAILKVTKILGNNLGLIGLFAVSVGIIFMFSDDAVNLVRFMVPWFVLLTFFILVIILNYRIFGGEGNLVEMLTGAGKHKAVVYWIIIVSVVIVVMGLSNTYGQSVGPYLDEDGGDGTIRDSNSSNQISTAADRARGDGDVNSDDFQQNLGATLFHPRILGLVLILVIATFTILFLASD